MGNALVIHHNDPDGRMGGYIMMKYFQNQDLTVGTIEANYDMTFDFSKLLSHGDKVCIVDYSLKNNEIQELLKFVNHEDVIWIDHHKSAIEQYKDGESLDGIRYIGLSGCELAYIYYLGYRQRKTDLGVKITDTDTLQEIRLVDIELPRAIKLIGDYDCWRKQVPGSDKFIIGLEKTWDKLELTNPNGLAVWDKLFNDDQITVDTMISEGTIIKEYIDAQNAVKVQHSGFPVKLRKFTQYKAIAINSDVPNSWVFDTVFNEFHIGIVFRYNEKHGKKMSFSVYRLGLDPDTKIDCSKIAYSFGGGGHEGAAGFATSGTLPFEY